MKRLLISYAAVLSFLSLSYELLIVQTLTMIFSQTILTHSLTIGVFLASLGGGAFASERIGRKHEWKTLLRVESFLTVAGPLSVTALLCLYILFKSLFAPTGGGDAEASERLRVLFLVCAQGATAFVGFWSGLELPLLLRLAERGSAQVKKPLLIASNYAGALMGVLFSSWVLMQALDVVESALLLAALNWAVLLSLARFSDVRISSAWVLLPVVATLAFSIGAPALYNAYLGYRYSGPIQTESAAVPERASHENQTKRPSVLRIKTPYQYADLVSIPGHDIAFFLNGQIQIAPAWEAAYHESLIHAPIQLFGRIPKRALILGGGDGGAARELLKYRERVEAITLVELDARILELARERLFFRQIHRGALDDPKVKIQIGDAFQYIRSTAETFDAVYIDFPLPHDYDLLKLYSVEFYSALRRVLRPGGFISVDASMYAPDPRSTLRDQYLRWNNIVLNTVHFAGFQNPIAFQGSEIFLSAELNPSMPQARGSFKNHGIELRVLTPEYLQKGLRSGAAVSAGFRADPGSVNSIFKPKLQALPDPWF